VEEGGRHYKHSWENRSDCSWQQASDIIVGLSLPVIPPRPECTLSPAERDWRILCSAVLYDALQCLSPRTIANGVDAVAETVVWFSYPDSGIISLSDCCEALALGSPRRIGRTALRWAGLA
jgi:hypothetical protein